VASHSWEHRRIHTLTPSAFRRDVQKSKDALEQITGEAVVGFRAPTFSIVRQTAWAIDILAELGMLYDSSIYPVWHDRYGIPEAPRNPFRVRGGGHTLLEIPPATWQVLNSNVPVGGGGYFRLFPLWLLERAWQQRRRSAFPTVTMLYFHPWEFDARQARLPLGRLSRFRTYVGLHRSRARLSSFLSRQPRGLSLRALDVAHELALCTLPLFDMSKTPIAVAQQPRVRIEDNVQPALG
jgi:polysaccharide deacetylase family protein (PEP-CTERM system associated)